MVILVIGAIVDVDHRDEEGPSLSDFRAQFHYLLRLASGDDPSRMSAKESASFCFLISPSRLLRSEDEESPMAEGNRQAERTRLRPWERTGWGLSIERAMHGEG